jgi:Ca2+-binding RTX toxin-like protein
MYRTRDRDRIQGHPRLARRVPLLLTGAILPALALAADIVGTPGPDVLEGTTEADTIDGRGGADTMMGLPGNDTYVVGQADDEVIEGVGDGTDTVRASVSYTLSINVENMTLTGAAAIDGTGNGLNNRLTGNNAANTLNGRAGADRMFGRGGNDTFIVDASGDLVNESPGGGTDTVRSSVRHTLRSNVENLALTGTAAVNGTGNELPNSLRGNGGANTLSGLLGDDSLSGGGGNDRLIGGPGNDQLAGGPGSDEFQFDAPPDTATNQDRIVDFNPAADSMRLIGEAFPTLTSNGTLAASAFANGIVASGAAVRIVYDPATGILRYDSDGSGPAAAVRFARLTTAPVVTNADFTVVDPVATAVDYATQIQPVFNSRCTECHAGGSAPQGLRLDAANSYANLVNVASREVPSLQRVEPGDPDNSYLVQKVEGTAAVGGRMPLNRTPLSQETIALIRQWISEGANR